MNCLLYNKDVEQNRAVRAAAFEMKALFEDAWADLSLMVKLSRHRKLIDEDFAHREMLAVNGNGSIGGDGGSGGVASKGANGVGVGSGTVSMDEMNKRRMERGKLTFTYLHTFRFAYTYIHT